MRTARLIFAVALALAVPPAALAQEGGVNFFAEPVPGSRTAPKGGYFVLDATPGEEITQAIGLRNDSGGRLELRLAPVDATTAQFGGVSYGLATEAPSRTGAWLALERTSIVLEPKASAVVPFRVKVPPEAGSGHHLAGISVAAPRAETGAGDAAAGQAGASVDVQTRRIVAVQVNLPGPAEPEISIGGVAPTARPDGLYLEIAMENRGRGLTKGKGVLRVGEDFERPFELDTFVPGTSIAYPIKWRAAAANGEYRASVEVRYGEQVASWQGAFIVGQEVLADLADRQVAPRQPEKDKDGGGSGLSLPALAGAAAGGALLLGGGNFLVSRMRSGSPRRKR
ncbi:MAG: DUF916 domain-containing protein [Actinomycetota bacterium]|nr:DUF916 domain-containing protein [Actinomycetota bacterium]